MVDREVWCHGFRSISDQASRGVPPVSGGLCILLEQMDGAPFGYLDPGSGSMIVQAVVGGVAAAAVMGKLYWRRFLELIGVRKKDERR
jgi:hypothetical protein